MCDILKNKHIPKRSNKMNKTFDLWNTRPYGAETETPRITYFAPDNKTSDAAAIIFPGGGYGRRAPHEGEPYALLFNSCGMSAFVVDYRVAPAHFPDELLDARRAVRFVRANSEKFGIDKNKIAVMGSSAGGHLAAFVSTYRAEIAGEGSDELDNECYIPNAQILCYPVISSDEEIFHKGSYVNLLGSLYEEKEKYSPELIADAKTPPAFIWHTSDDNCVNVENSYRYATTLKRLSIPCEMHIFPSGPHGLGLAPNNPHVAQWAGLLKNWLKYIGFCE